MAKTKESKGEKDGKALVGRVKKVVKKSRRKMGEEKFEKELQRTIAFLEAMQQKLNGAPVQEPEKMGESDKKAGKKIAKKQEDKKSKAQSKPKTKMKNKPAADSTLSQVPAEPAAAPE